MITYLRISLARLFNALYWATKIKAFRVLSNKLIRGIFIRVDDVVLITTSISDLYEQIRPDYEKPIFDHLIDYIRSIEHQRDVVVFVDVGANIGRYSLYLAKKVS